MRHLLCSSTPTFRMIVSFVRTLKALCSFSHWDSAILKELWIKEVPVCTYETATLIYVLRAETDTTRTLPWTTPSFQRVWKMETPALLNIDMKDLLFSVPSIQVLLVHVLKQMTRPNPERQESPVWQQAVGSVVFAVYWSRSLLFSRLMLNFSLSSLFVQSVRGPFCHILAGGKSVINPQRCSCEDPFVVILLVMLLLSVVFNNNTIYGQKKNELEWVVVFTVAWEQVAIL